MVWPIAAAGAAGGFSSAIGAIGSFLGPVIGGLFGKSGQEDANRQNMAIAKMQMDFQERMSNTAYARAVADLQRSGLNPMLAIRGPGPESSPTGASARMENTKAPLAAGISQASSAFMLKQQMAQMQAQTESMELDNAVKRANLPYIDKNAEINSLSIDRQFQVLGQQLEKLGFEKGQAELSLKQFQELMPYMKSIQESAAAAAKLGLSEQEALAKFWKAMPDAKWLDWIRPWIAMMFKR